MDGAAVVRRRCTSRRCPAGAPFFVDIPSSPVFLGIHVYGQAWGWDSTSFSSGTFLFGNAIDWRIVDW